MLINGSINWIRTNPLSWCLARQLRWGWVHIHLESGTLGERRAVKLMSSTTWGFCVLCSPPPSIGPQKDAPQQEVLFLLWIPLPQGLDAFTRWHLIGCIKPYAYQSFFMVPKSGPSQKLSSICWSRSTGISFTLFRASLHVAIHHPIITFHLWIANSIQVGQQAGAKLEYRKPSICLKQVSKC